MTDKTPDAEDTIKPQPPPGLSMLTDNVDILKTPFDLSPHGNNKAALTVPGNLNDNGGGGSHPSIPTNTPLGPEFSSSSSFKIPRSVSRADSRLAAPLELALSGLERPDGAREARILLPGVDLRQHFIGVEEREQDEGGNTIDMKQNISLIVQNIWIVGCF
jgi:hypothetical protein